MSLFVGKGGKTRRPIRNILPRIIRNGRFSPSQIIPNNRGLYLKDNNRLGRAFQFVRGTEAGKDYPKVSEIRDDLTSILGGKKFKTGVPRKVDGGFGSGREIKLRHWVEMSIFAHVLAILLSSSFVEDCKVRAPKENFTILDVELGKDPTFGKTKIPGNQVTMGTKTGMETTGVKNPTRATTPSPEQIREKAEKMRKRRRKLKNQEKRKKLAKANKRARDRDVSKRDPNVSPQKEATPSQTPDTKQATKEIGKKAAPKSPSKPKEDESPLCMRCSPKSPDKSKNASLIEKIMTPDLWELVKKERIIKETRRGKELKITEYKDGSRTITNLTNRNVKVPPRADGPKRFSLKPTRSGVANLNPDFRLMYPVVPDLVNLDEYNGPSLPSGIPKTLSGIASYKIPGMGKGRKVCDFYGSYPTSDLPRYIYIFVDTSQSMLEKLNYAQICAAGIAKSALERGIKVAVINFSTVAYFQPPTLDPHQIRYAIAINQGGMTFFPRIRKKELLNNGKPVDFVFVSDGGFNGDIPDGIKSQEEALSWSKRNRAYFYFLKFNFPKNISKELYEKLKAAGFFQTESKGILDELKAIGYKTKHLNITIRF